LRSSRTGRLWLSGLREIGTLGPAARDECTCRNNHSWRKVWKVYRVGICVSFFNGGTVFYTRTSDQKRRKRARRRGRGENGPREERQGTGGSQPSGRPRGRGTRRNAAEDQEPRTRATRRRKRRQARKRAATTRADGRGNANSRRATRANRTRRASRNTAGSKRPRTGQEHNNATQAKANTAHLPGGSPQETRNNAAEDRPPPQQREAPRLSRAGVARLCTLYSRGIMNYRCGGGRINGG